MLAGRTFQERIEQIGRYSTVTHMRRFLKQAEFLRLARSGWRRLVQLGRIANEITTSP
jgi:hypothetical protein